MTWRYFCWKRMQKDVLQHHLVSLLIQEMLSSSGQSTPSSKLNHTAWNFHSTRHSNRNHLPIQITTTYPPKMFHAFFPPRNWCFGTPNLKVTWHRSPVSVYMSPIQFPTFWGRLAMYFYPQDSPPAQLYALASRLGAVAVPVPNWNEAKNLNVVPDIGVKTIQCMYIHIFRYIYIYTYIYKHELGKLEQFNKLKQ